VAEQVSGRACLACPKMFATWKLATDFRRSSGWAMQWRCALICSTLPPTEKRHRVRYCCDARAGGPSRPSISGQSCGLSP
jgi:hypothetical protein